MIHTVPGFRILSSSGTEEWGGGAGQEDPHLARGGLGGLWLHAVQEALQAASLQVAI